MKIHIGSSENVVVEGLPEDELKVFCNSILFQNWVNSVDVEFTILKIKVLSVTRKHNGDPIFAKLDVEAYGTHDQRLPGIVFLRGGTVAILPIISSAQTGQRYIIFTEQARLAIGKSAFLEIPAGMLDGHGNFAGIAAKEFEEEVGISLKIENLTKLTPDSCPKGIAVSPGACDETIRYYLFETSLPEEEINTLKGKATGNSDEQESIRLKVVPIKDALKVTSDSKFFTALALMTVFHGGK